MGYGTRDEEGPQARDPPLHEQWKEFPKVMKLLGFGR